MAVAEAVAGLVGGVRAEPWPGAEGFDADTPEESRNGEEHDRWRKEARGRARIG